MTVGMVRRKEPYTANTLCSRTHFVVGAEQHDMRYVTLYPVGAKALSATQCVCCLYMLASRAKLTDT